MLWLQEEILKEQIALKRANSQEESDNESRVRKAMF